MIVLVTYDLKQPGKDYSNLYRALESVCTDYIRPLESIWLFNTNATPDAIWKYLATHIDANDKMLITGLKLGCYGWLNAKHWDWINARIGN